MRTIVPPLLPTIFYVAASCSANWATDTVSLVESAFREQILLDLRKDAPALHLRILTSLPDPSLPELDSHFAARAGRHPWLFGHLLARYGTAAVVEDVHRTYDRDHLGWSCGSRFPFLAYFLRIKGTEGEAVLRRALQERKGNGCFRTMLSSISRIFPAGTIEAVAIDALYDADPETARDAAATLSRYGSANAEQHLWRVLQRWTERWRDRSAELYGDPTKGNERQYGEAALGDSLRGAISTAQAWYFDEPRRQRLRELCWTDNCRSQFEDTPRPTVRILVHRMMYGEPLIEVGWYHPDSLERLRAKVAQFPRGTVFGWCTDREGGGELDQRQIATARKQARDAVESQGFTFLNDPPEGSCLSDEMPGNGLLQRFISAARAIFSMATSGSQD